MSMAHVLGIVQYDVPIRLRGARSDTTLIITLMKQKAEVKNLKDVEDEHHKKSRNLPQITIPMTTKFFSVDCR